MTKSLEEFMNMSDDEVKGLVVTDGVQEDQTEDDKSETEADDFASGSSVNNDNKDEDDSDDEDTGSEGRSVSDGDGSDDAGDDDDGDVHDGESVPSGSASDNADESAGTGPKGTKRGSDKGLGTDDKGSSEPEKDKQPVSPTGDAKSKKASETDKSNVSGEIDYKAAYEQIMKPFKANGKEIKLDTVQEAIQLMQMGANYTKKMQAIQPNLKILRMLENNQLLDESKLSQLIDIQKGNKAAITKVMADNSIDPMDIDTEDAVKYKPSNHGVSDAEINFQSAIEEATSTDAGQELIIHINNAWDQGSKKAVFEEPELLRVLNQQKQDGIYDQIVSVVEKQKLLGNPQITKLPFIHAYKLVGEQLHKQGLLRPSGASEASAPSAQTAPREIARGTAPKRKPVTNDSKAKAASPSATSTKKASISFNPLSGSDEDFLKAMASKV